MIYLFFFCIGQHYQRRQNNSIKTPMKQKIDKYRRRSEEVTQALNGNTITNNGLLTTSPSTLARIDGKCAS